ncbi:3-deoxy-D-manno-octulosonic acid transferase [Phenylobacterium aquaticum]|uniref:3-deoxy-D-manno-octulosonic acid transferase n=1 Tax=Phenylobacterium aquaticum TaxID=1763816 RepID=UPI0026F1A959|nr:3-deoxy-D-manno-octulosonic acid transferase [Phenylobacterium aquaticum]
MRPASLALYGAATGLLEPLAPLLLRRRAAAGKEDPTRLGERLGKPSHAVPDGPLVWLHGVSVGESLSLLPLIEALSERSPQTRLLVTSGTRTSAELLAKRLPPGVIHQYAPIDGPRAVVRFLNHWRPRLAIFVESELWPNMVLAAQARRIRLALISARMTKASARGWGRVPAAARTLLSAFDLVLPQEAETAARLTRLGARVGPFLSLKLAGGPLPCDAAELARLRGMIGERPVILAASTHAGEEEIIARAVQATERDALLVIAPRHPERAGEIAAALAAQGFTVTRRSEGATPDAGVYLADTLGEMGLFFRLARAAIMGGSFLPGVGGHNPLEPARLGVAVVTGPHAFNARAVYDEMFAEVAALEAADEAALVRHIAGLIDYPAIARRIGEAGLDYAERQGAALDQALTLIQPLLRP